MPAPDQTTSRVRIVLTAAAIASIAAALSFVIVLPFLPGRYDPIAVGASTAVQALGILGLLLVPLAGGWLVHEGVVARRRALGRPATLRRRGLRIATLAVALLLLALLMLGAVITGSFVVAVAAAASAIVILVRLRPASNPPGPPWLAVTLFALPISLLLVQFLAVPLAQSSRDMAIASSVEIVSDVEAYEVANGHYPPSLQAVWHDYSPGVVGISPFEYAPTATSFQISFEQPHLLLDEFGVREFVVYSPHGDAGMTSHDSWILLLAPDELQASPGWFARTVLDSPNWASVRFD